MSFLSAPAGGGAGEARSLGQIEHAVHPLDGAAGCALDEIVDGAQYCDGVAVRDSGEVCVIARGDILHARRLLAHVHERRARVELAQLASQGRAVEWPPQCRLHRHVNTPGEGPRMRHESELRLDAGHRTCTGGDLGYVTVGERAVAVEIAVPQRVLRAID